MFLFLFKIAVLVVFVIETFIVFTINNLIDNETGEADTYTVAFNLISGYILRAYMLYCMLVGMGFLNVK